MQRTKGIVHNFVNTQLEEVTIIMEHITDFYSELRKVLSYDVFYKSFEHFLEQADMNIVSKKGNRKRYLLGCKPCKENRHKSGKCIVNGCALGQQFGQGGASGTPCISWYVVSIYYVTAQN